MKFSRTVAIAATSALAVPGYLLASAVSAQAAAPSFPAHYSAPYLQLGSSTVGDLAKDKSASGDKFYTLAFLIPKSGCTPEWEDGGDSLGAFTS